MVFNYKLKKTYTFFYILIFVLYSSISVSQEDNFDLDSDDFDLLEDTSFDQLELELEKNDLYDALQKLRQAINKINQEGKNRLLKAFEGMLN